MMFAIPVFGNIELLARCIGPGEWVSKATEWNPTSITILSVVVVGFIGYLIYNARSGGE